MKKSLLLGAGAVMAGAVLFAPQAGFAQESNTETPINFEQVQAQAQAESKTLSVVDTEGNKVMFDKKELTVKAEKDGIITLTKEDKHKASYLFTVEIKDGKATLIKDPQLVDNAANVDKTKPNSWQMVKGKWHFYQNGKESLRWVKDNGKWYYFNPEGVMQTGWVDVAGTWYYFGENGDMQTGWIRDGHKWYYLNKNGDMQTGWISYKGDVYLTDSSGAVLVNQWVNINNEWYYFGNDGAMVTQQWFKVGDKWYFAYQSGRMARSTSIQGWNVGADGAWIP